MYIDIKIHGIIVQPMYHHNAADILLLPYCNAARDLPPELGHTTHTNSIIVYTLHNIH